MFENLKEILYCADVGSARLVFKSIAYEAVGWPWGTVYCVGINPAQSTENSGLVKNYFHVSNGTLFNYLG